MYGSITNSLVVSVTSRNDDQALTFKNRASYI